MDLLYNIVEWGASILIIGVFIIAFLVLLLSFVLGLITRFNRIFQPCHFHVRIKNGEVKVYGKITDYLATKIAFAIESIQMPDLTAYCGFSSKGAIDISIKQTTSALSKKQIENLKDILKENKPIELLETSNF